MNKISRTLLVALALALHAFTSSFASNVKVELLSEHGTIAPGQTFTLALKMDHPKGWHSYWINPGIGLPTRLEWSLPEGFEAGPIQWPTPHVFISFEETTHAYEGESILLIPVTAPASITESEVTLRAKAYWQECDDEVCENGEERVRVKLAVAPEPVLDANQTALFQRARAALPINDPAWIFSFRSSPTPALIARVDGDPPPLDGAHFFIAEEDILDRNAPQKWAPSEDGWVLPLTAASPETIWPKQLTGVLTLGKNNDTGHTLAIQVVAEREVQSSNAPGEDAQDASSHGLIFYIFAGFLGGIILNLMPCVFPVISLKIMGFVHQAHGDRSKVLQHGLIYAAGVVLSFLVMAGVIIALRSAGSQVGWAAQMQDPRFVIGIALLLTLISLNLFGVFEIGQRLTGVGVDLQNKEGAAGSFFTGVLAVVIGAPCSGPLMAGAVGWAFTQSAPVALVVFLALGLGMAAPYVLLSARPAWLDKLPRPGPWMETFKQSMGFLMLLSVLFFIWVLSTQQGAGGIMYLLLGMLIASVAAWIYGRWCGFERKARTRHLATLLAALILAGGVATAYGYRPPSQWNGMSTEAKNALIEKGFARYNDWLESDHAQMREAGIQLLWEPFNQAQLDTYIADGKPVFIDYTASWCLTCQGNKKTTLHKEEVEALFHEKGVQVVMADWSDKNEPIARALSALGRSSVPVYAFYDGKSSKPTLLPQILSPSIVREAVDSIEK